MDTHQKKIAIIGYGYIMPGAIKNDQQFWDFLCNRDIVREPVEQRYGKGYAPLDGFGGSFKFASRWESLITDGDELAFDCKLFGLSPKEAGLMDPQIKMMLTTTWRALEQAGQDQLALRNSDTGVFVGTQVSSAAQWRTPAGATEFTIPGQSIAMIANRISYHFNWMGPSMCTMTACSAGITALNVAVNALSNGECSMAVAGAVNYLGSTSGSTGFNALGIVSPNGIGRSFDANGDGYVRAEGAFSYILKTLDDAERDGDHIHAVIRATRCNTAGAMDGTEGFSQGRYITAPTEHAQVALMRETCRQADLTPGDIDYLEAHATGTPVGDRVEGNAIGRVFHADRTQPLRVASVKSNVGHMEAASFSAGLLKAMMMFKHRTFAPISRSFREPNPEIDFDSYNMVVQTDSEAFPDRSVKMGINSFGFGGANGHCILEEYLPSARQQSAVSDSVTKPKMSDRWHSVPLSAKTDAALIEAARSLSDSLPQVASDFATIAGNLACRRSHFPLRTAICARSTDEFKQNLDDFVSEQKKFTTRKSPDKRPRILMVFSGQGTQWSGCGKTLYDSEPVFRQVVDVIDRQWLSLSGESLKEKAFSADSETLNECQWAQPTIFMIQAALYELLKTNGVYADVVTGHSAGEVGAAYASGVFSLEQACRLVYARSRAQQKTEGSGRMLVIGMQLDVLKDFLASEDFFPESSHVFQKSTAPEAIVELACENAPESNVLCAPEAVLRPLIEALDERGIQNTLIAGGIAFHSHFMDDIREEILSSLQFLSDERSEDDWNCDVPFVSTVTAQVHSRLDAEYWWSNVRQCVRLYPAMRQIQAQFQPDLIIEVSPHLALRAPVSQCYQSEDLSPPEYLPTLIREQNCAEYFARCLGALYQSNVQLDYQARYPQPEPITHLLPGHPMVRERMIDSIIDDRFFQKMGDFSGGPLLGRVVQDSSFKYETCMSANNYAWMADHVIQKLAIVPAAAYIEMIFEALGGVPTLLEQVSFLRPCSITDSTLLLQTELEQDKSNPDRYRFTISSREHEQAQASSQVHCVGWALVNADSNEATDANGRNVVTDHGALNDIPKSIDVEHIQSTFEQCAYEDQSAFYGQLQAVLGDYFQYGENFQVIERVYSNPEKNSLLLHLEMDEKIWRGGSDSGYHMHPILTDGVLQSFICYQLQAPDTPGIPREMRNFFFLRSPKSNRLVVHLEPPTHWQTLHNKGQLTPEVGEQACGRVSIYDAEDGELIAYLEQYNSFHSNEKQTELGRCQYYSGWQPKSIVRSERLLASVARCFDSRSESSEIIASLVKALRQNGHPQHSSELFLHIVELFEHETVEELVLNQCLDELNSVHGQYEYCALFNDQDLLRAAHEKFHVNKAPLRFESVNLTEFHAESQSTGMVRPAMAECAIWKVPAASDIDAALTTLATLLVPNGWLILTCESGVPLSVPPTGWLCLGQSKDQRVLLLESPDITANIRRHIDVRHCDDESAEHWVLSRSGEVAKHWISEVQRHPGTERIPVVIKDAQRLSESSACSRLEYFDCLNADDDPLGLKRVSDFSRFMQRLVETRSGTPTLEKCKLTVFTLGAMHQVTDAGGASVWGAVRSLALEVAEAARLDLRLVDIGDLSDLTAYAQSQYSDWREQELVIRDGQIFCHRIFSQRKPYQSLVRHDAERPAHYHLALDYPGQTSGLRFKAHDPDAVGSHDVEVEIQATALNFRDIMVMLGRLPLLSFERSALGRKLGMEASGVVRRIGSAVTRAAVGDRVIVMQGGCIANRVLCHEDDALPAPSNTTPQQSAALASVYVTAYYALMHLSRMKRGQTLLVHSAMGGVGQAAIALAKYVGVDVYATAGSDAKRQQLRDMGVIEAFDSHSYDWHEQLMQATAGEGVDIVLNSLAGYHIELCLESLKAGGWHCEIGKMDIYADNALGLKVFRKNLRFLAIDVDRLMTDDPELARELGVACLDLVQQGHVPPIAVTDYPYSEYEAALRCMMNGQHTGKLVLTPPATDDDVALAQLNISDERRLFDKDASYLLSGGLGGFGLRMLAYLVSMGARHILVLDRDQQRRRSVQWLRANANVDALCGDVKIEIVHADVADPDHVSRAIAQLEQLRWPALKGVFHLAGVLDDKLLTELDDNSYETVFAPKAQGAWNLHQSTQHMALDHFVMLSSISSLFGNPSQCNYAAANSFLDSLASMRHGLGLPALAYNMSAISDAGMASRSPHVLRMMKTVGTPAISSIFAIEVLDSALRKPARAENVVSVLPQRFSSSVSGADYLRIGHLINNKDAFSDGDSNVFSKDVLLERVMAQLSELCGHDEIDENEPLSSYGLNSISVVELGAFIKTEFDQNVSALELMTSATCASLVQRIVDAVSSDNENDGSALGAVTQAATTDSSTDGIDSSVSNGVQSEMIPAKRVPSRFSMAAKTKPVQPIESEPVNASRPGGVPPNAALQSVEAVRVQSQPIAKKSVCKLDGRLPPHCEQDLSTLKQVIREKSANPDLQPAAPVEKFRAVLVTGATGFIGRLLLHELCASTPDLTIHCLIRADDERHAWQRLVQALRDAEIWHEQYRSRIAIHVGDISQPQLGLSDDEYASLCQSIDAVYHFAADVKLAASYDDVRKANTASMENILALCFERRRKPIYYASTMGIFPQYFCTFANEYADEAIESEAMPRLAQMKKTFPMNIIGYPWSKLVVEQALLSANAQGLPVGIFRIPQTAISAATGYSQHSDIKLCLVNAVLETRSKPRNLSIQWSEPVDTICQFIRSISLNPQRRHLIYHCCHSTPSNSVSGLEQLGFDLEQCSYETFKQRCLALGEKSAAHGYWILLDHFAPYWMSSKKRIDNFPIAVDTLHADSSEALDWPGMLQCISASLNWARRHQDLWPHAIAESTMHVESGIAVDAPYQQAYQRLLDALELPDAAIKDSKKSAICFDFHRKKLNVDNLKTLRSRTPAIAQEQIEKPVFILGMNRTGTTFLHRLMSRTPAFQAPRPYEFVDVQTVPDADLLTARDPRREFCKDLLAVSGAQEALAGIHTVLLDDAEEDFSILENAFLSHSYSIRFNVPKYDRWLAQASHESAYRLHHEWLQYLSWQRRQAGLMHDQRWLLKMPFHLFQLQALLDQYPDAVVIQTHRDPSELIPSWCHLVENLRKTTASTVNKADLGHQQLHAMKTMINGAMQFRRQSNRTNPWLDVSYYDLVKDPVATVGEIYTALGHRFDRNVESTLQQWLRQQQKQRAKEQRHHYSLQDYALTQHDLEQNFADYYSFLNESGYLSGKRNSRASVITTSFVAMQSPVPDGRDTQTDRYLIEESSKTNDMINEIEVGR